MNKPAAEAMNEVGASACTDVTGFGLFGHLISMARHSGVTVQVYAGALPALAPYAFSFSPLPMIRLACALWPGDEDFPSKASILFDASASHYMPTDGLALLGSGLARRLIKATVG